MSLKPFCLSSQLSGLSVKRRKKNSKVEKIAYWNIREGYENERSKGGSGKRNCTWKFLKGCENEIRS